MRLLCRTLANYDSRLRFPPELEKSSPDGHFKFLHLWPGQNPPGQATVVDGLLLGKCAFRKAGGSLFEAVALALEFQEGAAV
jgi:hypothetical protein